MLITAALLFAMVSFSTSAVITAKMPPTPPDSCLILYRYTGNNEPLGWNEDSVRRDECWGSPTFYHAFAKKWFMIEFPRDFYPFDHVLDTNEIMTVNDIDSSHLWMKNRFLELQDTVGAIYFCGNFVKSSDSVTYLQPRIRMSFGNYQDVDYIVKHFAATIDSVVDIAFLSMPYQLTSAVDEAETNSTVLYPNPVKEYIFLTKINTVNYRGNIEIFSLDGKKVLESEYREKIDVSFLQSGVYILKTNNSSIKFIKE